MFRETGRWAEKRLFAAKDNVFRLEGDFFQIEYEGKRVQLKDLLGVRYIHYLLSNPGKEFTATELMRLVQGTHQPSRRDYASMTKRELAEKGLEHRDGYIRQNMMDEDYKADVKKRLKEACEAKATAERRGDEYGIKEAAKDIQVYARVLRQGTGKEGSYRAFSDPTEKDRISVSKAIHGIYRRIMESHPPLYEHLKASIKPGWKLEYTPKRAITWKL